MMKGVGVILGVVYGKCSRCEKEGKLVWIRKTDRLSRFCGKLLGVREALALCESCFETYHREGGVR